MKKKKKGIGKWIIIAVVIIIILTAIFGGGNKETSPGKETAADQVQSIDTAETAANDTFRLNETAVFPTLKITALEIKESTGDSYVKPADGKVFVGVRFKIENVSDEDEIISSLLLFDGYVDQSKTDPELMRPDDMNGEMLDGTLSSGMNMEGYYIVQANADWKELELHVKSSWLSNNKAKFILSK